MADFVPQMPSEDEDFDAVIEPKTRKPRTRRAPADAAVSSTAAARAQSVQVNQPDPEPTPDSAPEEPAYEISEPASEPTPIEIIDEDAPAAEEETPSIAEFVEPFSQSDSEDVPEPVVAKPEKAAKQPKPPKAPRTPGNRPVMHLVFEAVLLLLVVGLGIWSWQLYSDRKVLRSRVSTLQSDPQATIQKQTDSLISDVSKLLTLPTGETPTIANVSDAAQARQQSAFFNNAQNGDKVLMYVKAGEAILYRPSTNKIILVAPLTFNSAAPAATTQP